MRDQLIQYVDLLFAGSLETGDIKQEILQNTLDRYDDLVAQGKAPEAAYSLAISGIGDISEILGENHPPAPAATVTVPQSAATNTPIPFWKKLLRALAVCLYIICPIPLFVLSELGMDTLGLSGTLAIVAVATAILVVTGGNTAGKEEKSEQFSGPQTELRKATKMLINILGLAVYLILSFVTSAWYITWLIFPIMGAVRGLITACIDLKEASKHES